MNQTTRQSQASSPVIRHKRFFKRLFCCGGTSSLSSIRIFSAWLFLCLFPLYSIWKTTVTSSNATDRLWNEHNYTLDQPILPPSSQTRKRGQFGDSNSTQQPVLPPKAAQKDVPTIPPRKKRKQELKDKQSNSSENAKTYFDFYLGARFPNGSLGYVADPKALATGRQQYLQRSDNTTTDSIDSYWKILQQYQIQARNGTETAEWLLDSNHVCGFGPGQGFEEEGGYKLLVEKIRIHRTKDDASQEREDNSEHHQGSKGVTPTSRPVRVMCAIYTYPRMRDLLRTQALSWGYKCDGFLAFSTETIAELGLINFVHEGPESYMNMWQKVRSLWIYLYHHYGKDYDFFHLGGDDLYMIVENFRHFLQTVQDRTAESSPVFLGQWIPIGSPKDPNQDRYYVAGAPGYTLNQRALQLLVEQALPNCHLNVKASYEDRLISKCLRDLNIIGQDTREKETGQQQYHDCGPGHLYTAVAKGERGGSFHAKLMSYWEGLPHPKFPNTTTGSRNELNAAATYSVNFHNLYHPLYAARIHTMLYKQTCPTDSPLGRGLRAHLPV